MVPVSNSPPDCLSGGLYSGNRRWITSFLWKLFFGYSNRMKLEQTSTKETRISFLFPCLQIISSGHHDSKWKKIQQERERTTHAKSSWRPAGQPVNGHKKYNLFMFGTYFRVSQRPMERCRSKTQWIGIQRPKTPHLHISGKFIRSWDNEGDFNQFSSTQEGITPSSEADATL